MRTSEIGKNFIKGFESLSLKPYRCPAGIPTIGWGTTRYPDGRPVKLTDPSITRAQADAFFEHDLSVFERDVLEMVKVTPTQCQFDALVSFTYNVGPDIDADTIAEGLGDSTLLRKFNAGDIKGAADEFLKWDKSRGKVLAGLDRRRQGERKMFLGGVA